MHRQICFILCTVFSYNFNVHGCQFLAVIYFSALLARSMAVAVGCVTSYQVIPVICSDIRSTSHVLIQITKRFRQSIIELGSKNGATIDMTNRIRKAFLVTYILSCQCTPLQFLNLRRPRQILKQQTLL